MTAELQTRIAVSSLATEIYVSAAPVAVAAPQEQWRQIFTEIRGVLTSKKAFILEERLFGTQQALDIAFKIRSEVYGPLDDGVSPTLLVGDQGLSGSVSGVQVHAVIAEGDLEIINLHGQLCGRVLRLPGRTFLALSNITPPMLPTATDQADAMLKKAESAMSLYGTDLFSVPRTWMWLKDILAWYNDFNKVRNDLFIERGLITKQSRQSMPASTGIGLAPAKGTHCSMDLVAVVEPKNSVEYLRTTGKQHCAFEYGSAFSRATRAITPAGHTVYISGTASIDTNGATTNIDDPYAQINDTIENVRAVLREMDCTDQDVVQVIAYCKTTEVEKIFNESFRAKLDWPWVTAICDVCRDDLLFEIEAAAMPKDNQ